MWYTCHGIVSDGPVIGKRLLLEIVAGEQILCEECMLHIGCPLVVFSAVRGVMVDFSFALN